MERLDQALGQREEVIAFRRLPPRYWEEQVFAEPITQEAAALATAGALAQRLSRSLEEDQCGARRLELSLFRVDGVVKRISIGTSRPLRDPALMKQLLAEKINTLQHLDIGYGFDGIRLAAPVAEALWPVQPGLDEASMAEADLAGLIDRLNSRFGSDRLTEFIAQDSHIPERAVAMVPVQNKASPASHVGSDSFWQDSNAPLRPIRLLEKPEAIDVVATVPDGPPAQFRWRHVTHRIAQVEGPERISLEWWASSGPPPPSRDYFRIETIDGRRFWLFREGLYERETPTPRWFLHGFFA
jgi:protein ImuB